MFHSMKMFLCIFLAVHLNGAKSMSPKIAGGNPAPSGMFPQTVSLQYQGNPICGASILNANWALTAANCISGPSFYLFASIYSGSVDLEAGGSYHNTSEIIVHEEFSFFPKILNDIALIRVDPPFDLSDETRAAAVVLPEAGFDAEPGVSSSLVGWGQPTPNLPVQLFQHWVELKTVSDDNCSDLLNDASTTMCAVADEENVGNCYGDNGAPLLLDGVQLGIVSWSLACNVPTMPTVFTQVSAYVDWINQRVN